MDVVEAGALGVRSAVAQLVRRGTPLRFTIYPMIHLAEPAFYAEVSRRLRGHDLIVAEGISRAPSVNQLTKAYRRTAARPRRTDPRGVRSRRADPVADMLGKEFTQKWSELPLVERLVANVAAPLTGLYLRTFGTREALACHLVTDDDTDIDDWHPELGLDRLIKDERDALLIQALTKIHEERQHEQIDVAIAWGAAHVPPIVAYLMSALGYVVIDAEWITVFDY
ncbi:hypothetical protein LWC34_42480 [Kibdelosporangium philippinense]|uniref:Uncharacterized protein n=1 Tax=Kibdelosporangium philippinense TaxID=211113 RepID=A0ABS8ZSM6_9PSEU|nr:hypothetical protein [Kibdelosporangium philippinense]MCE7009438.1 hypothetical protein [Kibdelosporangium philippinense]